MITVLDSTFKPIVYDVPYTNLVWNSRWYDIGEFQMQIPVSLFDEEWAYLVSSEQDEIGVIQKREYKQEDGGYYLVSGMFSEVMLNNQFSYESSSSVNTSLTDAINRIVQDWYVNVSDVSGQFPITIKSGDIIPGTTMDIPLKMGVPLANFLYDTLQPYHASFRISRGTSAFEFRVKNGRSLDLILDSSYGDIVNVQGSIDMSPYKNVAEVYRKEGAGYIPFNITRDGETIPTGYERRFYIESTESDDSKLIANAKEELAKRNVAIDLDADLYDVQPYSGLIKLGDEVTLRVPEMNLDMRARIAELTTVYNQDGKSMKIGFGDKRVPNVKRLVESWMR